jgi:hypothetical protein
MDSGTLSTHCSTYVTNRDPGTRLTVIIASRRIGGDVHVRRHGRTIAHRHLPPEHQHHQATAAGVLQREVHTCLGEPCHIIRILCALRGQGATDRLPGIVRHPNAAESSDEDTSGPVQARQRVRPTRHAGQEECRGPAADRQEGGEIGRAQDRHALR